MSSRIVWAKCRLGQNVVLRHPHKIRIGDSVVIDDNCLIDAKGTTNDGIRIGDGVFIGRNTILSCKTEYRAGARGKLGFNCEIFFRQPRAYRRAGARRWYCYLIGGDHDFSDASRSVLEQARPLRGHYGRSRRWLGAGAKILDGVAVGAHAIVGAGAVVRESVPDNATAVGVPARIIGTRA